jgi:hypothetical protein
VEFRSHVTLQPQDDFRRFSSHGFGESFADPVKRFADLAHYSFEGPKDGNAPLLNRQTLALEI